MSWQKPLTPAHHLPAPGCSPLPPASLGLYCSGRCCCCFWGQRLPRIPRSPTATRWGSVGSLAWDGSGRDREIRILGWLLVGKILPFLVGGTAGGHCLEQSGGGWLDSGPGFGLVGWRGPEVITGHLWCLFRNAQMAMSGIQIASTAGVSVPGGPITPSKGEGITASQIHRHLQELQRKPNGPRPTLVLWGGHLLN